MTNKEKFQKLVSNQKTNIVAENKARIKNRARLRAAQDIALKVLNRLDELHWKQVDLAKQMNVTAQQVSKIVSGKGNLTLETIVKLEKILNISILQTSFESKQKVKVEEFSTQPVKNIGKKLEGIKMIDLANYSGMHNYQSPTSETETEFENAS